MKREEYEEKEEYSFSALQRNFFGAKISDDLFDHMAVAASRLRLVRALTDSYLRGGNDANERGIEEEERGARLVAEGDMPRINDLAA